jgi:hypothetical protein
MNNWSLRINSDFRTIGTQFLTAYYNTFSTDIKALSNYYLPTALVTYMLEEYGGIEAIRNKFNTLQLQNPKHTIIKSSVQPVDENRILIMVTGTITESGQNSWLVLKPEIKVTNYTETFILINENKNWFIQHHIFYNY